MSTRERRRNERPTDPEQQVEWLYSWWKRLDQWLRDQGEEVPEDSSVYEPGGIT